MKKLFINLVLLLSYVSIVQSQTVLKAGDIAIAQVNYTSHCIDFVPLVDIQAGTEFFFTDYFYKQSLGGFDTSTGSDGIYKFTAPENITAGTIIPTYNNSNFVKTAGSSSSIKLYTTGYIGEHITVFQVSSSNDTTFVTTFGWMREKNYEGSYSGYSDIPPGLSKTDFTVVEMDSLYFEVSQKVARDYKYRGNQSGSPYLTRKNLSYNSNYNKYGSSTYSQSGNFSILAPDSVSPELEKSFPVENQTGISLISVASFTFNETVEVKSGLTLQCPANNFTVGISVSKIQVYKNEVSFDLESYLSPSSKYILTIPVGFLTDENNNPWPKDDDIVIPFSTAAIRNTLNINFETDKKENLKWVTNNQEKVDVYGDTAMHTVGYFDFKIKDIPMKLHREYNLFDGDTITFNEDSIAALISYPALKGLQVDLSAFDSTIYTIKGLMTGNNCPVMAIIKAQNDTVDYRYFENTIYPGIGGEYGLSSRFFQLSNTLEKKLDSLNFTSFEGSITKFTIEFADEALTKNALGDDKTICQGDSVTLKPKAGIGMSYSWNTGETSSSIVVKNSGEYIVTLTNTLGSIKDTINISVKEPAPMILPKGIVHGCLGDTVSVNAGSPENTYLWSLLEGETHENIRKITQAGTYYVHISNGACITLDSVNVQFGYGKINASFLQGGMTGSNDVQGQLYKKNDNGNYDLYQTKNLPQFATFDSLTAGEYLLKAHFVSYSFSGENPFVDTYHDGSTSWLSTTPINISCETDTTINFLLASKNSTVIMTGQAVISGTVGELLTMRSANTTTNYSVNIYLTDSYGNIIASTTPDTSGAFSFRNLPSGTYGILFERIGFTQTESYNVTIQDGEIVSNVNFAIDLGKNTIYKYATVGGSDNAKISSVSVSPNPVIDNASVLFNLQNSDQINLLITDLSGKQVFIADFGLLEAGVHALNISLKKTLPNGSYILRIKGRTCEYSTKIIVR